jgi:hypothetical protein
MSDIPTERHASGSHLMHRDGRGRFPRRFVFLASALFSASVTGCTPPGTNLSGTVTLDGRPVEAATLQFYPAAGDGQTSYAFTDKTGKFLARVSPVPLVVTITKAVPSGEKMQSFPDTPAVDVMAESLAPRYSDRKKTELKVTPVEGKTTVADFVLTSDER